MSRDLPNVEGPLPIVLGGDVGAYSLGLECYEAFGARPLCVASNPVAMITESKIFDTWDLPALATDEELLATLQEISEAHPNRKKVLLTTTDAYVVAFGKYRAELEEDFCVPYASLEAVTVLSDKITFSEFAETVGVPTPKSLVVDFAASGEPGWEAPEVAIPFPLVAKPASGAAYLRVQFEGKKKIYFIDGPEELEELWLSLKDAGFRDRFVLQQVIPGDDTYIRNLTLYVSSKGKTLMRAAAQVLLEDPSPTLIGNPVAMLTRREPELWEMAERILSAADYKGFVNFDVKIDPRDGTPYFLDLNPRIGRTSYYIVAGGVNPMVPMVRDLCFDDEPEPVMTGRTALFSLVPIGLIKKYVKERALVSEVTHLARAGLVFNPLASAFETSPRRKITAQLQRFNYYPKFRKHWRFGDA